MAEKKRFVNPYNFIPFEGNINDKPELFTAQP